MHVRASKSPYHRMRFNHDFQSNVQGICSTDAAADTLSNGNIFRVTGQLRRPVTRSFDIFFDLRLYKRLSKQS